MTKIKFIREHEKNGTTYLYFVKYADGNAREFINYDSNGRTIAEFYDRARLPKQVQNFIASHRPELERVDEYENGDLFTMIIYRA